MNIYFVCTGNTCRSPMAEAILRSRNLENVAVRSAGIHASDGVPVATNAKSLIEDADMPYTSVSKVVTNEGVAWADIILTMTESHKYLLLSSYPEASSKVFTLKDYVTTDLTSDVHDPFGGDMHTYKKTFAELSRLIDTLERKLAGGKE